MGHTGTRIGTLALLPGLSADTIDFAGASF